MSNPRQTLALTYLGYAHRKQRKHERALNYYHAALAVDGENWIARSYLGEAHIGSGNLSGAYQQLALIETGCGKSCVSWKRLAG